MRHLLLILLLALSAPVFTGCVGPNGEKPTPQAIAYFTLFDTWQAADGAMKVYAERCKQGKVSAKDQEEIDAAHEKFRLSFKTALRLAKHDWSASAPENVQKLSDELLSLISIIKS